MYLYPFPEYRALNARAALCQNCYIYIFVQPLRYIVVYYVKRTMYVRVVEPSQKFSFIQVFVHVRVTTL